MAAVEVRNVVKRFESVTAVAGVDLDVAEGECFGLLGPNGAGKTSLVRMIMAASPITSGTIRVHGEDISKAARSVKAKLGVIPQEDNLDPDLTVLENLLTFSRYFDIPKAEARRRADQALQLFELQEKKKAKIDQLSGGMKRRLLIARALINQPALMILDEPTVGLDPQTKYLVWQRLTALKEQGTTLLLCTQNMEEAARLCDRLAIMNEGRIAALGAPDDLLSMYGGSRITEARFRSDDMREGILALMDRQGLQWQEIETTIYIFEDDSARLDEALKSGLVIINQHAPNLEDVFLKLTGRSLTE
jgi:lipooligosaccharide transport system ATP-binding protein